MALLLSDTQLSAGRQERLEEAPPNIHVAGVKVVALRVIFFVAFISLYDSCLYNILIR